MRLNKGINLGGWLSQCVNEVEHFETFITEEDFKKIKGMGFDHVRIPMDYFIFEDDQGNFSTNIKYAERAILWAKKYDLDMILDLHKAYGYAFDVAGSAITFFNNEYLIARFYRLWEYIVTRFVKYKGHVAFELLNEVTSREVSPIWNKMIIHTVNMIRNIDKDCTIIFGGTCNNSASDLPMLPVMDDINVIYTFHCYDPLIFTHQGAYWVENMPKDYKCNYPLTHEAIEDAKNRFKGMWYVTDLDDYDNDEMRSNFHDIIFKDMLEFVKKNNLQLYCGEYGVINLADKKQKLNWYKAINSTFSKYNIRRALWSYKEMDYGMIDEENSEILSDWLKLV